ncbi:MAG: twin-arginine translocase subunit TatC, partial [Winogradskyella sp.]|nr:twin-arginine translocase subunit TatC [Winogradskyella sp.]
MAGKNVNEMSFLDHLEDLRWHLIRAVLGILVAATLAFVFKTFIFDVILLGPKHMDFPTYRWLCKMSQLIG